MHRAFTFVLCVVSFAFSFPSNADEDDADSAVRECEVAVKAVDIQAATNLRIDEKLSIASCSGLMAGLKALNEERKVNDRARAFCEPDETTNIDLARSFVRFYQKDPKLRVLPAASAARIALQAAFPCKK